MTEKELIHKAGWENEHWGGTLTFQDGGQ